MVLLDHEKERIAVDICSVTFSRELNKKPLRMRWTEL